jgi:secretion/DNA translocation related CpaE-like protein
MTADTPLLVTRDDALAAELLRLAAAAGAPLEVVPPDDGAVRGWAGSGAVLVGSDVAAALAPLGLPRRDEVHVVGIGPAPEGLYRSAVDLGAASVLELPTADTWLVELLTDIGDDGRGNGVVVAFTGGSGGVGATTLAAALALVAGRRHHRVALVDLDPAGPGLRRVAGFDEVTGVTWAELGASRGRIGSRSLREALPAQDGVGVLGWPDEAADPPAPGLLREVVSAARRGHDWVVLDLPRSAATGADAGTLDVVSRCDHVVVVARASLGSVAATARLAERLRAMHARLGLVVRSRRGSPLAEELAGAVGVPLLAELTDQRRLDEHLDLGAGPVHSRRGPLARTASALLAQWGAPR